MRVVLLTGKGGVGKTCLAAATALGAAAHGHRVLLLSTDAAHSVGDALGQRVGPEAVSVAPGVDAREVAVLAELARSWAEVRDWLEALLVGESGPAAEELLVLPGLEELVALRGLHEAEASGRYDVCIVDCAPTAGTLRMLRLPDVLHLMMSRFWRFKRRTAAVLRPLAERVGAARFVAPESVFDAFERLAGEIEDTRQVLLDESRTSARLVVNPARVVVAESRRWLSALCLHGIAADALLVNRVLPEQVHHGWFARWAERESAVRAELAASFPLPRFEAALRAEEPIGVAALGELARELYGARDPADRFVTRRPIRVAREGAHTLLEIDLPTADADELAVSVHGDELRVAVRDAARRIALPASLVGREVTSAVLEEGVFRVAFADDGPAPP